MSISPRYLAHTFGTGAHTIELFLDYVCPFSKKMFDVIYEEVFPQLEKQYPGKFKFVFRHQIQPWHPSSTLVAEAGIAVALLGDQDKFWKFSNALFGQSSSYYDEAVYHETRPQTYDRLAELARTSAGVDKKAFLDLVSVPEGENKNAGNKIGQDVKNFVKFARQNSIHVSPTVTVDGVVDGQISSGWSKDQWLEKLGEIAKTSSRL
ncbi:hypothetical protein TRICI_006816 [Trichomonascus ciferrii]|uniref:Thioredoxin-like fold domain-containing protein n=1 Tax=Trichomonascus ciferrii TaxID=44093 RepID=A0A642UCX1_9ASCO|nr:hypothetical protein TRICI_006816 [Trichomonascus ciferrii]